MTFNTYLVRIYSDIQLCIEEVDIMSVDQRTLKMKFAGRFIELLGHQMYGGVVPAIAEFIANAWDAEADCVNITFPESLTVEEAEIRIRDFGVGMTFDELNEHYLHLGYERRKTRGERTPNKNRKVMGRKGIGKLAGFGIAEFITIRSIKGSRLVQFTMEYLDMVSQDLNDYEFIPEEDCETIDEPGVEVILQGLKVKQNMSLTAFRKSMARRFALNSDEMEIIINGEALTKEELDFEYLISNGDEKWIREEVPGFGEVKYWFGFLVNPITDTELRGVSVFANKRMAQSTPFFFNISGGINGQVGLEYLTGQVQADDLDSLVDCISTDRQSVNWQFEKAARLEEWGQMKIKQLCSDRKKRKDERLLELTNDRLGEFGSRIDGLPKQERDDLKTALHKIARLERINEGEFRVIANSVIEGFERESVKKVIRKINQTDEYMLEELVEVIQEWDIISAVSTAEVVFGKIEIIKQFDRYIKQRLPEKAPGNQMDMQTFIKSYPWLLGYEYEHLKPADFHHEHGVDKWIRDELLLTNKEFTGEKRRFDLLCAKDEAQIVILELMRPGEPADYDHASRLYRYVSRIQQAVNQSSSNQKYRNKNVYGLLIADDFANDPSLYKVLSDWQNIMTAHTWNSLFQRVFAQYREYVEYLKLKAPEDPRMKGLVEFEKPSFGIETAHEQVAAHLI